MRRLLAVAVCCSLAGSAKADARGHAATPTVAPFWQSARSPGVMRAEDLVRQARMLLYPALVRAPLVGNLGVARRVAIDAALARLDIAHRLDPKNTDVLYLSARALSHWQARDAAGQMENRRPEAIGAYLALRREAPEYEPYEVAFELAILYTQEDEFALARNEWRRALAAAGSAAELPTVVGNLAEVTMMSGDLASAVELYERALVLGDGTARLLSMWGLAIVLDRLGEPKGALRWATQANAEDKRPMAALHGPGVFFEPSFEIHYYTGLGQLAEAGRQYGGPVEACREPLAAAPAMAGATRPMLQVIQRLAHQIGALLPAPEPARELESEAQTRLQERNRVARREGDTSSSSTPQAEAFVSALAALRDFARYLDAGGRKGDFAETTQRHVDALAHCLSLTPEVAEKATNHPSRKP